MAKIGRPLAMSVEDRRAEILTVAEQLFGEQGFEQVTMTEIARLAGMSKKTLYVYFSDKKALLTALVASSFIWSQDAFAAQNQDSVKSLHDTLKIIAQHVLSERHLKLCRLAISESVGIEGLTNTFYEMGIVQSRQYLIRCLEQIAPERHRLSLDAEILADMLFGACIGKSLIDALLMQQIIDFKDIEAKITTTVQALFCA